VRDLLLYQRVCQRWSILIKESPTLQTTVFFQPSFSSSPSETINPLLKEVFPAWFDHSQWRSKDDFPTKPSLNAIIRKEASWRKMLVVSCSPKGTEFIREIGAADRGADDGSRQSVKGMEIRMGTLYDLCQKWCMRVDKVFVVRYYPVGENGECKIRLVMYHPENWFLMNYRSSGMPDNRALGFEKHRSEAADDASDITWGKVEYTDRPFGEALR
jgi:hypothetical protein